jgi:phosphotriesterase-related protein
MTVRGPVPASDLGATLAHEHIFFDLSAYFSVAPDDPGAHHAHAPIVPAELWWLRAHPMNNAGNLVQADLDLAAAEVAAFALAGGGTIVDVTTVGLAPQPLQLAEVARRTGLHIVAGTGFYIDSSLPASVGAMSVDALADHLRGELLGGMAGTTVRAGLIGELGVGDPPSAVEARVLQAAARVQAELGCAVSIHPYWGAAAALAAARTVEDAGIDPSRTVISHLDVRFRDDPDAYQAVARRGFYLGFDTFGRDAYYPSHNTQLPADSTRIDALRALLDAGFGAQLLCAQDICYRHELVAYGGHGYAHILRSIRPRLLASDVPAAAIDQILVDNPRRWLAGT